MSKLKTNTIQHTGGSADNITLDNSQNVTVENNLTVDGTSTLTGQVSIGSNGTSIAENNLNFQPGGAVYIDHRTTGQDIQVRMSTSSALDTTGPTFKSNGNLAFASGKGIDFSATADGTAGAAELFSDYEEGEFTPSYSNPDSNAGFAQYHQYGYYTRIGNVVTVSVYIQGYCNNNAGGNTADNVKVTGLPFAPAQLPSSGNNRHQANWAIGSRYKMEVDDLTAYAYGGNTYIDLYVPSNGGTGVTLKTNQIDQNTTQFNATTTYRV